MLDLRSHEWKVLDKGLIKVIDYMGDDQAIVDAARVSYGKGTRSISDDRTLIRYLMRHSHSSPLEMCELKLLLKMPIYCARQLVRHRTASMNEESQRYSEVRDEFEESNPLDWRFQSTSNKQGSEGIIEGVTGIYLSDREKSFNEHAMSLYNIRLGNNVAREQARKCLPLSVYTSFYWKIDLRNLLHFLRLRMDEHAQKEIRDYANIIGNEIVSQLWPLAWEAFCDYQLNAISLSGPEIKAIQCINKGDFVGASNIITNKREYQEFKHKLDLLGIKDA